MANSKPFPGRSPWISFLLVIAGLGCLLADLMTGFLSRTLSSPLLWFSYLILLISSVWGMKTLIETNDDGFLKRVSVPTQTGQRAAPTRNLWKLPGEGQMYLLMLIILLLGALFGKTNTLMLMFALMAGPFIVNGGVTFAMTRRMMVRRRLPERVMAGETLSVDIILQNRKRFLSSCLVAVEDRILGPREILSGKLVFAQIPARSERTGRYQAQFVQRGQYRLGPVRAVTRFPLGIVERGLQIEIYDTILVYPRLGNLASSWQRRLTEGQEASRTARGRAGAHHDEFHRIREYRIGDELRSIHWKTTARRNELMVREYRQNRDQRLVLILDFWSDKKNSSEAEIERLEHAASLAMTIGWNFIQQCGAQQMDFLCFGNARTEWIAASRSEHTYGWLDLLALAEAGSRFTMEQIETEAVQRQNASTRCVIVTTRSEKDYGDSQVSSSLELGRYAGTLIVEADPEKTREFFVIDP